MRKKSKKWWQKLIGPKMTTAGWLSVFVFGLGQLKNKQKGKAFFFFIFQLGYVLTEIASSSLVKGSLPNQPIYWGYGFFRKGIYGFMTLGQTTGGDKGGELIAVGTPETVAKCEQSYTGHYLAQALLQYPPKKQDNIRE